MRKYVLVIFAGLTVSLAQTTVNPDFSVIGDLIIDGDRLTTSGVELAVQGYVNPFARADVFLHKHAGDEAIHLEEAFLSIERGLPFNMGLRSGIFRPDLGKINREHVHTYPFIVAPKAVESVLGHHMWSGTGLEADILLPLPWYSKLAAGYFANGIIPHHVHDETEVPPHHHDSTGAVILDPDTDHDHEESQPTFNARWSHFFALTAVTHLEMGAGYYQSMAADSVVEGPQHLAGVDFKFKWRPDRFRSFTWQGEYFRVATGEPEPVHAVYTFTNLQFNQVWNAGVVLDYCSDVEEATYLGTGIFVGYSPAEESSVFRLRVHWAVHGDEAPELSIMGPIIWGLGPHKPHRF